MRAALLIFLLLAVAGPASAQVAVIANQSVPVTSIDADMLLDIYMGEMTMWSSGDAITLIDMRARSTVKDAFYEYLGMSASRLKSIWMKKLLTGEGNPPELIPSEDEIIRKIASTPGAIGYVSRSVAQAAGPTVVTLLEIEPQGPRLTQ